MSIHQLISHRFQVHTGLYDSTPSRDYFTSLTFFSSSHLFIVPILDMGNLLSSIPQNLVCYNQFCQCVSEIMQFFQLAPIEKTLHQVNLISRSLNDHLPIIILYVQPTKFHLEFNYICIPRYRYANPNPYGLEFPCTLRLMAMGETPRIFCDHCRRAQINKSTGDMVRVYLHD